MSGDDQRTIRWGILGAGTIAATVGDDIAATPGNSLRAVGARDAERAAAFAAEHGVARSYGSYGELVTDPDVDVVYIATTHGQHRDHALLTIEAGKPVLVEKAFTLNAAQAREVATAARVRQVFCMEAMWMRLNPLVRQAAELAHSGRIGDVIGVRADLSKRFAFDPTARLFDLAVGGGALLDLGVYPLTFAWLVLGRPSSVSATGRLAPTGSDLTAALQLGYPDGRVAQVYASAAGDSPLGAVVTGTEGWITIGPRVHHPDRLVVHERGGGEQVLPAPPVEGHGYRPQAAEVARCLREGLLESPLVPLDDSVAILEIVDEARRQLGVRYPGEA